MQIIRLNSQQITAHWDEIARAMEQSLPGEGPVLMANVNSVMKAMLAGRMQCWVGFSCNNGSVDIYAIAATCFLVDEFTQRKDLLIYAIYGYKIASTNTWAAWLDSLRAYARAQGCNRITAYSEEARVLEIVEALGGQTSRRYIELEV